MQIIKLSSNMRNKLSWHLRKAGWVKYGKYCLYWRVDNFLYFSERYGYRKYIKLGKLIIGVEINERHNTAKPR